MVRIDKTETVPYLDVERVETSYGLEGTSINLFMRTFEILRTYNINFILDNSPVVVIPSSCYEKLSKDSEELKQLKRILNE